VGRARERRAYHIRDIRASIGQISLFSCVDPTVNVASFPSGVRVIPLASRPLGRPTFLFAIVVSMLRLEESISRARGLPRFVTACRGRGPTDRATGASGAICGSR
jgi:hypothetical protein